MYFFILYVVMCATDMHSLIKGNLLALCTQRQKQKSAPMRIFLVRYARQTKLAICQFWITRKKIID